MLQKGSMTYSLDVIIVNYNSTDFLLSSLRSLYGAIGRMEARILVQDNGSRDDASRICGIFPSVFLKKHAVNKGFARAANEGMKDSAGRYILLLNPDTYATNGFLLPILQYMEDNQEVGIVGPRITNKDGSIQGSARSHPSLLTALFGRSSFLSKVFPRNPVTRRNLIDRCCEGLSPIEVDWVSGACMVVRRDAINDVGPLDERFFMYWEDADWCRRMREKGWKVMYFPQSRVVHFVGGSSEQLRMRSILEFHKSAYRLFDKYPGNFSWVLKPMVVGVLALRLCAVMTLNGLRVLASTNKRWDKR
jgi:GT2 family glycosyltransferase